MFRHICVQFDTSVDSFQYRYCTCTVKSIIALHNNRLPKYQYQPSLTHTHVGMGRLLNASNQLRLRMQLRLRLQLKCNFLSNRDYICDYIVWV